MKYIFIAWIVLKELVEFLLHVINLRYSLDKRRNIPAEVKTIISEDRFSLSRQYLRDHTIFGLFTSLIELIFTFLILILIAKALEVWSLRIFSSTILQGLFFFAFLFLIQFLISIPFSLYENFKIEAKYGFNKTTISTFVADLIKSILITFLLGGLVLSGILYILITYQVWWWRLSIVCSFFLVVFIWLFPVLLMPIFNKFKPLDKDDLRDAIIVFTQQNKINIQKIYVMDASTRTTHGNAFLTGIGFSRRLVLFDTILDYPKEEILSIIAHEWGHHKHHDIYKQLFTSILSFVVLLFLSNQLFLSGILQKSFLVHAPYTLLFYSFTMISPILFFLSPVTNFLIRKNEYEADRFSLLMTRDINSAITSLKRLIRDNLSNLNPHPLYQIFYYTHPAPEERIQFLLQKAKDYNIS